MFAPIVGALLLFDHHSCTADVSASAHLTAIDQPLTLVSGDSSSTANRLLSVKVGAIAHIRRQGPGDEKSSLAGFDIFPQVRRAVCMGCEPGAYGTR